MGAFALAKTLVGNGSDNDARPEPTKASPRRSWRRKAEVARKPVAHGLSREPDSIYLAEHYIPGVDAQRVDSHVSRLVDAAKGARRVGMDVVYLGSAGLPGDESLLSLFSAKNADDVERTIDLAKVAVDRIVPVLWRAGADSTDVRGLR
jgi:hypothetical protein